MSVTLSMKKRILAALLATACFVPTLAGAQPRLPWPDANPLERWFGKPGEERPRARRQSQEAPAARSAPAVPAILAVPVPDARPEAPGEEAPATDDAAASDAATLAEDAKPSGEASTAGNPSADDVPAGGAAAAKVDDTPEDAPRPVDGDGAKPNDAQAATPAAEPLAPSVEAGDTAGVPTPRREDPASAPSSGATSAGAMPSPETVTQTPKVENEPVAAEATPAAVDPAVAEPIADPSTTADKPLTEIPVPEERPDGENPEEDDETPADPAIPTDAPAAPAAPEPAPEPSGPAPVPGAAVPAEEAPNATEKLKARTPDIDPATAVLAAAAVADAELCEAELEKRGVKFTVENSISEGECGVLRPLSVETLASGVKVSPNTQFLCRTALALDDWMTQSVVPAAKADFPDDTLTEFRHASTYVCRPRASEQSISEHARGSAVDIAAFVFETREEIGVEIHAAGTPEAKFQDAVRAKACGPFKTVLGPGTDADHATHFHLDIAARSNGSTYCK